MGEQFCGSISVQVLSPMGTAFVDEVAKYVFVVLLWPLIGLRKQVRSFSTRILPTSSQRSPARCRRALCRSSL